MNTKTIVGALIMVTAFAVSGCAARVSYSPYSRETFAPTTKVDVLRTKSADRRYIELGELCIRVTRSTQDTAVLRLTDRAREIGADGIVLTGERSSGSVAVPIG